MVVPKKRICIYSERHAFRGGFDGDAPRMSKETYIHSKETHIHSERDAFRGDLDGGVLRMSKETYIHSKETYIHFKHEEWSFKRNAYSLRKGCM